MLQDCRNRREGELPKGHKSLVWSTSTVRKKQTEESVIKMKTLSEFIKSCTDSWHTAAEIANTLEKSGFTELKEGDVWNLESGGNYYVIRNMSSVIAFKIPDQNFKGYMIAAAHSDSPCFKIKSIPEITDKHYIRLNTEGYGGITLSSWLDRPLSVSGRVVVEVGDRLEIRLVNLDRDSLIIPSLAPHLDRTPKGEKELGIGRDMPPLYARSADGIDFMDEIAQRANTTKDKIKGHDLMLYNREEPRIWGRDNEFISAPRLDDLQCIYALLGGFIKGANSKTIQVYCAFDNEEVGSGTRQGAKSDFLSSTLLRISETLGLSYGEHMQRLSSSFIVSADNAHAIHPNRSDASDPANFPQINGGVVIKYNASQRYTTDALSEAIFKKICDRANIPYQVYANRSDIAGGSTLGNFATEKTCVPAIDVGLSQLAMHSSYETAGAVDTQYLTDAINEFYNSALDLTECTARIDF